MALIEDLTNLKITKLETLLKECLLQRPDMTASIPDNHRQKEDVLWMIRTYGEQHADVTRSMLPYFPPGNTMTRLAQQLVDNPGSRKTLGSIAQELAVQDEEGYIAGKNDISIGRMLRYLPDQWHSNTYFNFYYCFSGHCNAFFHNETIPLSKGSVLIIAPGTEHACPCYEDDAVLVFYMIRSSTFKRVFWDQMGDAVFRGYISA